MLARLALEQWFVAFCTVASARTSGLPSRKRQTTGRPKAGDVQSPALSVCRRYMAGFSCVGIGDLVSTVCRERLNRTEAL